MPTANHMRRGDESRVRLTPDEVERWNAVLGELHPEHEWYVRPGALEEEPLEREVERLAVVLYDSDLSDPRRSRVETALRTVLGASATGA